MNNVTGNIVVKQDMKITGEISKKQTIDASVNVDVAATPYITVGETTTLEPNVAAKVELAEESTRLNPVFNFAIPKGEKGEKGDSGSVKFIIANELPNENIDDSAIYMIPAESTTEGNTYEEYIYVDGNWESLGSANVNVDLADYVKNTDYATKDKAGVVKINSNFGITIRADGVLMPAGPSKSEIDGKTNTVRPLTPHVIDYAVKKALSDCRLSDSDVWTDDEKASARELLGVNDLIGNINIVLASVVNGE